MAKKKTEKEVANKMATTESVREHSFGSTPRDLPLSKGAKMAKFGYRLRDTSIFPSAGETVSVDAKTKFPEDRGF